MEQGLSFGRYEVYKDSSNTQLVKVHDYKAGKYVAQATQPDGDDAVPIDSAAQSAHDNAAPTDTVAWSAEEVETPADTAAISAGDHAVPKHETGQADLAEDDALEVADLGNNNSLVQGMVDANPPMQASLLKAASACPLLWSKVFRFSACPALYFATKEA